MLYSSQQRVVNNKYGRADKASAWHVGRYAFEPCYSSFFFFFFFKYLQSSSE